MHLDSLPIPTISEEIRPSDYIVFEKRLKETFLSLVPTAKSVFLLSPDAFRTFPLGLGREEKEHLYRQVIENGRPVKAANDSFIFPLAGEQRFVAVVSGMDRVVVEKASSEWLFETAISAEKNFIMARNSGVDPVTSLPNAAEFKASLEGFGTDEDFHVLLIEMLPRARSPREAFNQVLSASRTLKEFNRSIFPLYHLGQSIFAITVSDRPRAFLKSFCMSLISSAKNKSFKRIHCGYSSRNITRSETYENEGCARIVNEAWHALHEACKRGPFAFCDYDFLANPGNFPLKRLSRSTYRKLQRLWGNYDSFSLIYFKPDQGPRERIDAMMSSYIGENPFIIGEEGYFVVKEKAGAEDVQRWAKKLIRDIKADHGEDSSLSAGLAQFPFHGYAKTKMIRNCQKALIHASFFGPGSVVLFDSLSLNISGDVYFGEGDLAGAVREYRKGLELHEEDINLLNSLGVAYALMNKTNMALEAFGRALTLEPDNFMALYNRGLGEQTSGNYPEAVKKLTKALQVHDETDDDQLGVLGDLTFQLGVALFKNGSYQECIDLLENWYKQQDDKKSAGRCCRYIGISYYRCGRLRDASKWLQRGLSFDEFDAESMSILGQVYLKGGQGDDIALKLCEKSVELASDDHEILLRYGKALDACGYDLIALEYLRECARRNNTRYRAWLALAEAYGRKTDYRRSRFYLNKLISTRGVPKCLRDEAHVKIKQL